MSFRVLIVDDSPVMRRFIRRVMDVSGFDCTECLEAGDGQEALEVLVDERVDLILTDINMPRMSGEEFVRRLRVDEGLGEIPVLVVSTDATRSQIMRMLSIGVRGYVAKPFTPEMLRRQLERLVGAGSG